MPLAGGPQECHFGREQQRREVCIMHDAIQSRLYMAPGCDGQGRDVLDETSTSNLAGPAMVMQSPRSRPSALHSPTQPKLSPVTLTLTQRISQFFERI